MVWPLLYASGLLVLGALTLPNNEFKCPECNAHVKRKSQMCKNCRSLLRWD